MTDGPDDTDNPRFLEELMPRPWTPGAKHGFRPAGLFVGKGANAIEVAVAWSAGPPTRAALLESWKSRKAGRAAPVLLVVLHPEGAALCGASGEAPPVWPRADTCQVERLGREVLEQPDRHAALRFLAQALPSLETALPGINNEGLAALHELQHGAPGRPDWAEAGRKAGRALARKSTGSYYTKPFAVEHLLDGALAPALTDHFARLADLDDTDAAESFFDFRVADIAMGSGHFLIAAIDRIEKGMADFLSREVRGERRPPVCRRRPQPPGAGRKATPPAREHQRHDAAGHRRRPRGDAGGARGDQRHRGSV